MEEKENYKKRTENILRKFNGQCLIDFLEKENTQKPFFFFWNLISIPKEHDCSYHRIKRWLTEQRKEFVLILMISIKCDDYDYYNDFNKVLFKMIIYVLFLTRAFRAAREKSSKPKDYSSLVFLNNLHKQNTWIGMSEN